MEDCVIVVAIEAELEEVAAGEGDLLRPELEGDVACSGVQDAGGGRLGLEIVERRHFDGICKSMRPRSVAWRGGGAVVVEAVFRKLEF